MIYRHLGSACYYKEQGSSFAQPCNVQVDWSNEKLKIRRRADNKFEYLVNDKQFHTSSAVASSLGDLMFHASFSGNGKIVKANALATAFSTVPIQWINAQNSITSDDGALTQNGGGWGSSYADANIPSGATYIEF